MMGHRPSSEGRSQSDLPDPQKKKKKKKIETLGMISGLPHDLSRGLTGSLSCIVKSPFDDLWRRAGYNVWSGCPASGCSAFGGLTLTAVKRTISECGCSLFFG